MPKTTLTFDDTNKAPSALEPFLQDGKVTVWYGTDETAVAAELNVPLEKNRNDLRIERDNYKTKYDALVTSSSKEDIDNAKILAELETAKKSVIPEEDKAILQAVKQVFPNMSATDLAKQIPQFKTATEKVVQYEKEQQNQKIFGVLGYKNAEAFKSVMQIPDMLKGVEGDIFVETVTPIGKTDSIEVAHVNVKNAAGALEKKTWEQYTTEINPVWKYHIPSLMFVEGEKQEDTNTWVKQGAETKGEGKSFLDTHIQNANKIAQDAPNPFMPKPDPNSSTVNQN